MTCGVCLSSIRGMTCGVWLSSIRGMTCGVCLSSARGIVETFCGICVCDIVMKFGSKSYLLHSAIQIFCVNANRKRRICFETHERKGNLVPIHKIFDCL